jgi:hypothetical protein
MTPVRLEVHVLPDTISHPSTIRIGGPEIGSMTRAEARKLAHDLLAAVGDPVPVAVKPWVVGHQVDSSCPAVSINEANGTYIGFAMSEPNARQIVERHNGGVTAAVPAAPAPKSWVVDSRFNPRSAIREADGLIVGLASSPEEACRLVIAHNRATGNLPPAPEPRHIPAWLHRASDRLIAAVQAGKGLSTVTIADAVLGEALRKAPDPEPDWVDRCAAEIAKGNASVYEAGLAATIRRHAPKV